MTRVLTALALLLLGAAPVAAQDMPLSQILIDGAGWKKVEKPGAKPEVNPRVNLTFSTDGGTAYLAGMSMTAVLAVSYDGAGIDATRGVPYAPLRTRRGANVIDVGGLATDRDGRIYAATELGVQVFDPTGRLCGVLTPAAPGTPDHMTFEGDTLTLWIGDAKYTRKLRTEGVK